MTWIPAFTVAEGLWRSLTCCRAVMPSLYSVSSVRNPQIEWLSVYGPYSAAARQANHQPFVIISLQVRKSSNFSLDREHQEISFQTESGVKWRISKSAFRGVDLHRDIENQVARNKLPQAIPTRAIAAGTSKVQRWLICGMCSNINAYAEVKYIRRNTLPKRRQADDALPYCDVD
jgi:hypothetical protein